jgi:hypothetical protein
MELIATNDAIDDKKKWMIGSIFYMIKIIL